MDSAHRFRIATRIHYALKRELGEGIDVGMMLGRPDYAAEILAACRASGDPELAALAREFQACTEIAARPAAPAPVRHTPAEADADEEGSSVPGALAAPSRFSELADDPPPPRRTDTISDSGFPPLDPIGQPLTPAATPDGPFGGVLLSDEEAEAIDRAARQAGWPGPGLRRGPRTH
jgi:hypothetical protein